MSQQYHSGQAQTPYNFFNHQSTAQVSGPPHDGLPQVTLPPSHTLPPLPTDSYVSTNEQHLYASRHSALFMASQAEAASQSGAFVIYAPTGNLYASQNYGSDTTSPDAFQQQQQTLSSRPSSLHMQTQPQMQPAYTATSRSLPEIAPMPARSNGITVTAYGNELGLPQPEEKPTPSHVVGAQGRRGILPSTAGRPPAVVGANILNGQKNPPTPAKDADGKYPCPHCDKNYLHAKHLKRHLLRHTGVRPYACGLCNDTFSRSDILKRHFLKCSSRRGNPTGQNHLAHSRANKKAREQQESELTEDGTPTITDHGQTALYTPTSMDSSFDINSLTLNQSNYGAASNQVSRANSVTRSKRSTGSQSNRASLGMMNTSGYESAGYAHSTGHITPDSITTSGAATPYTFPHESRTSQLSENAAFPHTTNGDQGYGPPSRPPTSSNYVSPGPLPHIVGQESGRGYGLDWAQVHQYNPHEDYGNGQHHSGGNTPLERDKPNPDFSNLPLAQFSYLNQRT